MRESLWRIILILNSSIKQKDEIATRLFAEARLGFQWDCRTRSTEFDDVPIITQNLVQLPELSNKGASLSHEMMLFYFVQEKNELITDVS